jgi:predicted transcriptional regulator
MAAGFRSHQPGLKKLLGDLEASIMEVVWSHPDGHRLAVRDVYETLRESRTIAYTTVMTVMGNLVKKDILKVEKSGTAYIYYAPLSREDFTAQAVGSIVDDLMSDFSSAALAHFARVLDNQPDEALARLRARIEQAKQNQ